MIVIERREIPVSVYKVTEGVSDVLNFDYCFVKSNQARVLSSSVKGLVLSLATLTLGGFPLCVKNHFVVGFVFFVALAFVANQIIDQKLSHCRDHNAVVHYQKLALLRVNSILAIVPVVFLFSTMDMQTMMIALSNTIEVVGIACGVPLLLYGLIKLGQESNFKSNFVSSFGRTHVCVGSASAFGGVAFSIAVNIILSSGVDASIFSATNYFSNAIAAIYAPNVVLQLEE